MKTPREWIYINNPGNTTRYVLGIRGQRPLICFGINPSTAAPDQLDNTLKAVERQAFHKGFDSWIMLNIYPQRATDPNNIHNGMDADIHQNNLHCIGQLLSGYPEPFLWAAWGTLIGKRAFLAECLRDIHALTMDRPCRWVTIGSPSQKGHPRHPLYLSTSSALTEFDIQRYVNPR